MSLNYGGINWIVRSYIMLHIKGGTKTSVLVIKRFFDILSWQGWCLWKPKWFMLDRTGSSVGSSALCSRRMQIRGQGQRRPKGVLRCKGRSGRKELDVKKDWSKKPHSGPDQVLLVVQLWSSHR